MEVLGLLAMPQYSARIYFLCIPEENDAHNTIVTCNNRPTRITNIREQ